jgi:hypothetical protein
MNARTLQVMSVVALAIAGAAWFSTRSAEPSAAEQSQSGAALFPELANKTAQVQSAKIQTKGKTFTLAKNGAVWGVADKGGYPVNFDKVKDLVAKLAYFKIIEKKTDQAKNHAKLELEDPDLPDAKSTRVTLMDAGGATLADIVIGMAASGAGPATSSMYVRRPGENQTYEVSGILSIDGTPTNWLDKQVAKLEAARVHKVKTVHGDDSQLTISKAAPDQKDFVIEGLEPGQEPKWTGVANSIAGALEYLNFDDVEPAGRINFDDPNTTTTTLQTFDGLLVTVKLLEQEEKFYAQLSAVADPAARVEVSKFEAPPPIGPTNAEADPNAPPPEPVAPVETKSVPGKSAEEVATEAAALEERLSKWTFVVPGYAATNFSKKLTDMLKEPEPPPPLPGLDLNPPPADGDEIIEEPQQSAGDGQAHSGDPVPVQLGDGR